MFSFMPTAAAKITDNIKLAIKHQARKLSFKSRTPASSQVLTLTAADDSTVVQNGPSSDPGQNSVSQNNPSLQMPQSSQTNVPASDQPSNQVQPPAQPNPNPSPQPPPVQTPQPPVVQVKSQPQTKSAAKNTFTNTQQIAFDFPAGKVLPTLAEQAGNLSAPSLTVWQSLSKSSPYTSDAFSPSTTKTLNGLAALLGLLGLWVLVLGFPAEQRNRREVTQQLFYVK